ncbi:hypothetical protein BB561_005349 [Smittium simulii]|uniref:Tyrosinase copper-binding domain-containing protein n=1 Tax=Smittium simulii TaxID=133385 RepID=A0A2T9YAT2_9FUNG|nr:hypothetical protein BB561_005349 [Smittium simulii]
MISLSKINSLAIVTIALQLFFNADAQSPCSGPVNIRKEIRKLTSNELNVVKSAYSKMYNAGWNDWFGSVHLGLDLSIHQNAHFLPWHRAFVRDYELVARYYEPSYSQPYWDASIDYSNPSGSIVFTENYLGGNGAGSNMCIQSGLLSSWIAKFPNEHCMRRSFYNESNRRNYIDPWQSPESVTSSLQRSSGDYNSFRSAIEFGIHASVHVGIGGDMSTMQSPYDPFFFLHHANIDRLWWKWQNMTPQNMMSYNGRNQFKQNASLNDPISNYPLKINDVMKLGYGNMCFGYDDVAVLRKRDLDSSSTQYENIDLLANSLYNLSARQTNQLKQENLLTSTSIIKNVTSVPKMSLAAVVDTSVLSKFFPLIASNDLNKNSLALPNVVTVKANSFASDYLKNVSKEEENKPAEQVIPEAEKTVNSTSIVDSLIKSTDKYANEPAGNLAEVKSNRSMRSIVDQKQRELPTGPTVKEYKMPQAVRLPDSFIKMMGYDINQYNQYYRDSQELVNLLNQAGYVSPYI